jgi:maleate isomerase
MGHRAKWGLIVPERNTVCESEMHAAVPGGITINTARIARDQAATWANDAAFKDMAQGIRAGEPAALARLMPAEPDYYIVGDAGFTIGRDDHEALAKDYEAQTGKGVATAARAYQHALDAMNVQRVAVLTPRLPASGIVSGGLWEDCGYTVSAAKGLDCASAFDIVNTSEESLREGVVALCASDAEVILATGTNIFLMHFADVLEHDLGKPILHINTVLLWYALRQNGFDDRIEGCGRLLREY